MRHEIELDVPLPNPIGKGFTFALKTLSQSPIGASVLLKGTTGNRVTSLIARIRLKYPAVKFVMRKLEGAVRVWRVA